MIRDMRRAGAARLKSIVLLMAAIAAVSCGDSKSEAPAAAPLVVASAKPPSPGQPTSVVQKTKASDYLPPVTTDEFNPDVPAADRDKQTPKRGGRLRVRNPANLEHLNVITTTGQPEHIVINHMADILVKSDPMTLEKYPEIAWRWSETDLIKRKGGAIEEGRIVERNDQRIVFIPGAWRDSLANADVDAAKSNDAGVTLTAAAGGARFEGTVTKRLYIYEVDEAGSPANRTKSVEIPLADLDEYEIAFESRIEKRPFAKQNCGFEFFIRDGVTWHDGQPFTAEDVKFSIDTVLNPAVDAQALRSSLSDVESSEVTSDGKAIKFHYRKPFFQALDYLAGSSNYFIPKHVFQPEKFGGDEKAFGEAFNNHPFKDAPIYTGPYKFASWDRANSLIIKRNESYWKNKLPDGEIPLWNKEQPYFDQIEWILYKEAAAAVKDLQNGNLDVDFDVEPTTWVQPDTNSKLFTDMLVRAQRTGFLYTYVGWNLKNPIFQDVNVRRALAMLMPLDDIAHSVHMDAATPVTGPFYVDGPGYDKTVPQIPHDPEGAIALLTKAGWLDRDGDGVIEKEINGKMVPFRFNYFIHNAKDYHQKIADIIKESVEQAKIEMNITKLDWSIFSDTIRDKNFDAVRFAWGQDIEPDPFQIWHSSQMEGRGDNFISYKNDRVDDLCVQIRETFEPVKRWEMAKEVHRILAEEQPVCFMFGFKEQYFINRKLRGVRIYPSQYPQDLTEWWWSETPPERH
ncbi:hypothetical protein BH09SUM1_BH09SUM1_16030 [soil metagenome]